MWKRISSESAIPTNTENKPEEVILNADHFVIEAEDVFSDEALGRVHAP